MLLLYGLLLYNVGTSVYEALQASAESLYSMIVPEGCVLTFSQNSQRFRFRLGR